MQVGTFHCETCGVACSPSRLYCSHSCAHKATQAAMALRQTLDKTNELGLTLPPKYVQQQLPFEPG